MFVGDGGPDVTVDRIVGNIKVQAGSFGHIVGRVRGGPGDDDLTLNVVVPIAPPSPNLIVDAILDGGAGVDTCTHTSNVIQLNCP